MAEWVVPTAPQASTGSDADIDLKALNRCSIPVTSGVPTTVEGMEGHGAKDTGSAFLRAKMSSCSNPVPIPAIHQK
jgi:hypothetical protein